MGGAETETEFSVGPHALRITGDTVLTRYIGVPEYEQVVEIHRHLDEVKAAYGRLFIINDMRRTGIPSTQTRQFIAEWGANHGGTEIVNFGASLPIRMVHALLLRAAGLIGKEPPLVSVSADDEAAAYAWVAARRLARGASKVGAGS